MRRLAGASVLVVIAVLLGATMATAAVDLAHFRTYDSFGWTPPEQRISGITYLAPNEYLVVDQNLSDVSAPNNAWILSPATTPEVVTAVDTGVDEPTGVHYDSGSDTLFITSDAGFIRVFPSFNDGGRNWNTHTNINTGALGSSDTEDPVFAADEGILYWMDGSGVIHWVIPTTPGNYASFTHGSLDFLNYVVESPTNPTGEDVDSDWESLTWDPETQRLMTVSHDGNVVYEFEIIDHNAVLPATPQLSGLEMTDASDFDDYLDGVSGMAVGPASTNASINSLWLVNRNNMQVHELNHTGTIGELPPPPTTTTSSTTPTTAPTTTTTAPTTTTTTPGQTTTTTTPGQTTTTTTPGGGGGGGGGPVGPSGFADIAGSTHAADIQWLADQGITKGCNPPSNTLFCPNQSVTRGQMAAFLGRAFGYTNAGTGSYFVDTAGNTFKTDIDRLRVAGVTIGCNPPTNDRFCPDQEVTRGQMAAFLGRAFGYTNAGTGNYFVDTAGNTFKTDIDRLRVAGVTMGCNPPTNNRYCPDEPVTRAQMATFLRRGFNN